ncbi:hypothetical protein ACLB2K_039140 [Fragaria x ananassa]
MSDEEHHFESKADAGASKTYPQQAGTIRKNGYIVIKNRPCKVVEVSTSKTGKHGHAKCHFVGIDIFTAKKLEDIVPSSHNCDVPHVNRTDYQLIDISEDGFVSLLTENGNTKDDLRLPTDDNLLTQIKDGFGEGKDLVVSVMSAMGEEQICALKDIAICKRYNSLAKDYNQANRHTRQLNKDLLPPPTLLIRDQQKITLVSFSEGKIYDNVELPSPPLSTWSCYSCGHGWLATVEECTKEGVTIELQHPLRKSSTSVRLPVLKRITLEKVILSGDPALNPDSYVVGATQGVLGLLAFTRARQQHWTYIQVPTPLRFVDAIFSKNQIYALCHNAEIVSVNLDSNSYNVPEAKLLPRLKPFSRNIFGRGYLVESSNGDLLLVLYIEKVQHSMCRIHSFKVYKVVFSDGDGSVIEQLLETRSIGDEALFLDDNHAVSVSVSNFPKCQRNSIYYSSNRYFSGKHGMRTSVFNLEDETITQPYPLKIMQSYAYGLWIVPSFNGLC